MMLIQLLLFFIYFPLHPYLRFFFFIHTKLFFVLPKARFIVQRNYAVLNGEYAHLCRTKKAEHQINSI